MADGDAGLEAVIEVASVLTLPVVVLGEYRYGIRHSRHRVRYELWLEDLLKGVRMLPIEPLTTEYYAASALGTAPERDTDPKQRCLDRGAGEAT